MHYHGSDIRGKNISLFTILFANIICVSTRDLMDECSPFETKLLPVLVPECFTYTGGRVMGTTLELDRDNRNIPYELMPFMLSLFEFYRDKKRIKITSPKILSKIGMEAIKCGTKVIVDSGEIVDSFSMAELNDYYLLYNKMVN